MNHFTMTQRKKPPAKLSNQSKPTDAAFDIWLNRGLHELYDEVANEPIPPELLKLLEEGEEK